MEKQALTVRKQRWYSGSSQLKGGVSNLSAVRRGKPPMLPLEGLAGVRHGGKFGTRSEEMA